MSISAICKSFVDGFYSQKKTGEMRYRAKPPTVYPNAPI